jgi:hypothetical protein
MQPVVVSALQAHRRPDAPDGPPTPPSGYPATAAYADAWLPPDLPLLEQTPSPFSSRPPLLYSPEPAPLDDASFARTVDDSFASSSLFSSRPQTPGHQEYPPAQHPHGPQPVSAPPPPLQQMHSGVLHPSHQQELYPAAYHPYAAQGLQPPQPQPMLSQPVLSQPAYAVHGAQQPTLEQRPSWSPSYRPPTWGPVQTPPPEPPVVQIEPNLSSGRRRNSQRLQRLIAPGGQAVPLESKDMLHDGNTKARRRRCWCFTI